MEGILQCLIVFLYLLDVAIAQYDKCNETIRFGAQGSAPDDPIRVSLDNVPRNDRGKPVYCWFRFEGNDQQFLQVDVRDIRAGDYDEGEKQCTDGFLRISDSESCSTDPNWFPPTTLCGQYAHGQLRVKRLTQSSKALVEFRLDSGRPSKGYQFDVTFLDKDETPDSLPYGNIQRNKGRIANTKCDWLIGVDECMGYCKVISPGYPGIYPPNTRCQYLFTSFDDARVDLSFGGSHFSGKFDLKNSNNCTEDYFDVYDGMSTIDPLIGRFCGMNGKQLFSTGSSLLVIFQSGPGGPPWDYSGFQLMVTDRWRDAHEGGQRSPTHHCNWTFESSDLDEGDLHMPDYKIPANSRCFYNFSGAYNEKVELEIAIRKMRPDCEEQLDIYNGAKVVDTICASNVTEPRHVFMFNTTGPMGAIKYISTTGHVSNPNLIWVNFRFWKDPSVLRPSGTIEIDKRDGGQLASSVGDKGNCGERINWSLYALVVALVFYGG